jgi:outer membrane receptor protein involved in Fe transport
VFLAVLLIGAGAALAQTSKGSIVGNIKDATGAAVPGALVKAVSNNLGVELRETETSEDGSYRLDALLPGTYSVKVTAPGFAELEIKNVEVRAAQIATVNGTVEVQAQTATVVVEAGVGQELQTQSGDLSGNLTSTEIREIPLGGLNPIALALTLPGVTQPAGRDDFTNGVGFSVNGTRPRGNNFLIDGQDNNDLSITGQAFQPNNLEAYSEVKIVTNAYSAEFGRGGGSVTNVVTRSGTNEIHGSAWNLFRNSALNANDASNKPPVSTSDKPVEVNNTFGFSVGGPLLKDKLFLFGSSQWDRFRSTANDATLSVPTDAGVTALQTLLPNPRIDALIQGLNGLRGDPSLGITTIQLGFGRPSIDIADATITGISQFSNSYEFVVRADYLPTVVDSVSVRYLQSRQTFAPDTFANPGQLPGFRTFQGGPSKIFSSSWVHTFGPKAVNDLRFAWNLIDFEFGLLPATIANPASAGPTSTIIGLLEYPTGGRAGIGVNSAFPQGRNNQTWQFQDVLTFTHNTHTLKFGFDVANYQAEQAVPFNSRGTITYNPGGDCGGVACTGLANYIDDFTGAGGAVARVIGSPLARPDQTIQSYYAEDAWRFKPNLTLTLGVRYEYFGTPLNVLDFPTVTPELGQFSDSFPSRVEQKQDLNNWAPRVGLAYTPQFWQNIFGRDKTVFRLGYGMFYDGLFNNILVNGAASAPNVFGGGITAPSGNTRGLANASTLISTITPTVSPTLSVTSVVNNIVSPITHQWNVNVQRELPWNFILTTAYVGTSGVRLFGNDELNYRINGVRINPARGAILVRTNNRHSSYHGGQFTLDRRFSQGLLMRATYTWSKTLDNGSEVFTTSGGSSRVQDFADVANDKGLSVFHRKHRVALTYIYDIPTIKNEGMGWDILRAVIRDWQVSGTYFYQSGAPETIYIGGLDTNSDGNAFNGRPNLGNPDAPFTAVGIDGGQFGVPNTPGFYFEIQNFLACDGVTIPCDPERPASDFRFLVESGVGNIGRNTIETNGRHDTTFGLLRTFKIPFGPETNSFEFRTEFFNPLNHPNEGIPNLDVLSSDFGNNELTRFGGREIRFWLKWKF